MSKSEFSAIEKAFAQSLAVLPRGLAAKGFVAGVSGGVDSMVMLNLFHLFGLNTTVVHVNYRRRGEDSDHDEELVRKTATGYGFEFRGERLEPDTDLSGNFQDAARKIRYRLFVDAMHERGHSGIALAHQEDDQMETILFKIFRGGGPSSWIGMKVWEEGLFRPLLDCSREAVEEYARAKKITYRTDRTNTDTWYARNYMRHIVFPELQKKIPGFRQNILKLPNILESYDTALDWIVNRVAYNNDGLSAADLIGMDIPLRMALVLHMVRKRYPGHGVSAGSLRQLSNIGELVPGKYVDLGSNLALFREKDHFRMGTVPIPDATADPVDRQKEPGPLREAMIKEIRAEELDHGTLKTGNLHLGLSSRRKALSPDILQLDAGKLDWPLQLRYWLAGDRFMPLGMTGTQLVSDHLTNRKIVGSEKKEAMVLATFDGSICAVIFPPRERERAAGTIDARFALDNSSYRILSIERL